MSRYKGLFTFDEDNHRYIPIAQADGIIDTMGYEPDSKPAMPLIKDEKIRKAVRAWADTWNKNKLYKDADNVLSTVDNFVIQFGQTAFIDLEEKKAYTIAELCGEDNDD